ncbi:unnamed protein product [Ectocarpus fasciculatus]
MTSFIERKVNEICGRWLDGFTKDNVDVSLLQAKITLSDLHFKTDELCLLSPTFAPSFFYVGKLSIDIPLAWNFSRPVKMAVSDVLGVIRVCDHGSRQAEDARRSISANVHVKAILSKLAAELGGGGADEGKRAARMNLQTAHNLHKVMRKLEVTVKNAHVRIEEPRREVNDETGSCQGSSSPAVAFGVCLRGISLGMDEAADVEADKGLAGGRWFGKKFRATETALLGNISRYDAVDGALNAHSDEQREAQADSPSVAGSDGVDDTSGEKATSDESTTTTTSSTLAVTKFASVRGASVYFCRDEECYSATDREETLRRLREDLRSPPATLPLLLKRCRGGVGLRVVLSAREWGKIESMDIRLLAGDINVQVGDDQLGYLLRWASLLNGHIRTLALSALRPARDLVPAALPSDTSGRSGKSRYYRALWGLAVGVVLRDLRSSAWQRSENARVSLQSAQAARSEVFDRPWSTEESEYRAARALLWRTWFAEWVGAARYLSLRQLLQTRLVVENFSDESGGIHNRLYEDLEVQSSTQKGTKSSGTTEKSTGERKLAKYLMPWQLPQVDVDKAWGLINRKTRRWELREAGGIKLAIDEELADQGQLDPAVLQALWSIQLQLDAQMPHRVCAFARRMAFLRVGWRSRIDRLWQARAEKQRRLGLGLGDPPAPPRLTPNDSISFTASEAGLMALSEADSIEAAETTAVQEAGDGADRVGTLLVRMGQLDGVGGVGLLSLAPKAIATLMLEESSATLEEMDLETNSTEVAKYDHRNERCCWNETFRLQVELSKDYVQDLRRERMKRHRRALTSGSCGDMLNSSSSSISPMKSDGMPGNDSRMKDARSTSVRGLSASPMQRPSVDRSQSVRGFSASPMQSPGVDHSRTDSMESLRSQMVEAVPRSSFLLSVTCLDKSVFGVAQLGTMTLPGKQLTSVPLKVLEHRCALFSPAAVSRQPRELTIETIFVPPGEDVALAEQELSAIGKRRRLQEKLDMATSKPKSSFGRNKPARGSPAALDASAKPARTSLDNVGEREVKVLSLVAGSADGSSGRANEQPAAPGAEDKARSVQRSIPIVDKHTPGTVEISMRAAGVTVVTYLVSSASLAREGYGQGSSQQDVVTLTEASARQIEACAKMDIVRGTFAVALEAATIQLLDKSLLRPAPTKAGNPSPAEPQEEEADAPHPQLMMVGPVGVAIGSTRYVRVYEQVSPLSNDDNAGMGAPHEAHTTPTPPAPGSQLSSYQRGRVDNNDSADGRDPPFRDVLGTWPMWDWKGRFTIGAYTVELGKHRDRSGMEEVWRHLRFSMPKSALEDTQVLHGGTIDPFGIAQSSIWLLRAGARGLGVEVQMPKHERSDVPHDASPKPYVYVSSSESETYSPPHSPSSLSPPSPAANGVGEGGTSVRPPPRLSQGASIYFPSAQENDPDECVGGSVEEADNPPTGTSPSFAEGTGKDKGVEDDSTAPAVGEPDSQTTPSNEELVRRVHELEAELKALRMSAAAAAAEAAAKTVAAATAAAATAATMGPSTQDVEAGINHAPET